MAKETITQMLIQTYGPGLAAAAQTTSSILIDDLAAEGIVEHSEDLEAAYALIIARDIEPALYPQARVLIQQMSGYAFDPNEELGMRIFNFIKEMKNVVCIIEANSNARMIKEAEEMIQDLNS